MTTFTPHTLTFEYETPAEKPKDFHVKIETEIQSGGYVFWVYEDETCAHDISDLIKDINPELWRDIDKAVFKQSEEVRENTVNELDLEFDGEESA